MKPFGDAVVVFIVSLGLWIGFLDKWLQSGSSSSSLKDKCISLTDYVLYHQSLDVCRSLQANAHKNASLTKLTRKHSSESACPSSLYVLVSAFREKSRECLWPRGPVSLLLLREFFSFCINIPTTPHPNLFWGGHACLLTEAAKSFLLLPQTRCLSCSAST